MNSHQTVDAVIRPAPVPDAAVRIFLFHHAGGSHLVYRDWAARMPKNWDVCLLDAPGRGRLSGMPPCGDTDALVDFFRGQIAHLLDRPFAFFGHSMGGLVAYELTNRLAAEGGPAPVWLGLSARGAPRIGAEPGDRHLMPAEELRHHLEAMGGTPRDVLADPDVWDMFEPMIRNDLKLVETWRPRPGTPPLTVPVSILGGASDTLVTRDRLAAWAAYAQRLQGMYVYPGGHFYFMDKADDVTRRIVAEVDRALTGRVLGAPR
ncbi:thioesterase [Nocardiopsis terrae]|uniref:Surfactin synthase thioesterase subunit n=1 Tax=Nocardiopsis terrae TaxID=372655 RepID=A0ABR9HD09_9ACTN|nr:alpha/beta fold hydrolase [Nocardiopsis terrae]MBE1456920.1 surfactin synthase thioesterase subunit [Nocardiopsis terrae]GHC74388.1 thioesterase [Nocardiopsis terrae]